MESSLDFIQRKINAEDVTSPGWFDPSCCILYLHEVPKGEKYDPNSTLMQMAKALKLDEEETEELKDSLQSNINEFLEKLPNEIVDEWKRDLGVSEDYRYDPSKEFTFTFPAFQHSQDIVSETGEIVSVHEYCHYLQFLRTVASPMLIWARMNLVQKAEILFQLTRQFGPESIRYPIKVDGNSHEALRTILDDPALWEIIDWHYLRPVYLGASDIQEAEAEFNSLLIGKHSLRFRYFRISDHPFTIHFRELNKKKPLYARAYLVAESALGDFAPSLFPLITYFALSMPFKKYSRFNIEDFKPVHPEEAFLAAISLLKKDISSGHAYAKHAQQLYRIRGSSRPSQVLESFCKKVCKANGWIAPSSRNIRKKWINRINTTHPFLLKLHTIFDEALRLEKKYGSEVFSEPFTKNHEPLLRSIPLPPLLLPDGPRLKAIADDYWSDDFVQLVAMIRLQMGAALSIFVTADVANECPHKTCRVRELNLCHGMLTYPDSADKCDFPFFFEDWSGLPLSMFAKSS